MSYGQTLQETHSGESYSAHEVTSLLSFSLFVTPWTIVRQAPSAHGISQARYEMGCHFLLQRVFPNPEIKSTCPSSHHCDRFLLPLSHQGSQDSLQRAYLLMQIGCVSSDNWAIYITLSSIFSLRYKPERKLTVIGFLLYTGHASHIYTYYF